MLRVLEECDKVAAGFAPDPVHDLRVSLRRCRSLADGLKALDPDPNWKAMKKAGRALFQRLGALRDIHVMLEWIEKIDPANEPAKAANDVGEALLLDVHDGPISGNLQNRPNPADALREILGQREDEQKREAKSALEEFDRKQWRQWSKSLPGRAARFRPGSSLFKHLALERWTQARELHNLAMRNRSQTALHTLRIGIKRFRYIVENFLPAEHKVWSNDLKEMQDLLGEVHDLDVLWSTALSCHVFADPLSRKLWHERIQKERAKRIERYRERMVGPESLWHVWRAGLPQGKQIKALALRRMKLWASGLDPDFSHSQRVARFAQELYKGLLAAGLLGSGNGADSLGTLSAAALLHDVGKSEGKKAHHKKTLEMMSTYGAPVGIDPVLMQRAAIVARFHQGALPSRRHKLLCGLSTDEQKTTILLAAILRLANAFDADHDGRIQRLQIQLPLKKNPRIGPAVNQKHRMNGLPRRAAIGPADRSVIIAAEGYSPLNSAAQAVAADRHLLETVLHRPVIVKAMKHSVSR